MNIEASFDTDLSPEPVQSSIYVDSLLTTAVITVEERSPTVVTAVMLDLLEQRHKDSTRVLPTTVDGSVGINTLACLPGANQAEQKRSACRQDIKLDMLSYELSSFLR